MTSSMQVSAALAVRFFMRMNTRCVYFVASLRNDQHAYIKGARSVQAQSLDGSMCTTQARPHCLAKFLLRTTMIGRQIMIQTPFNSSLPPK